MDQDSSVILKDSFEQVTLKDDFKEVVLKDSFDEVTIDIVTGNDGFTYTFPFFLS